MSTVQSHFARLRAENPDTTAKWLLVWARDAVKVDAATVAAVAIAPFDGYLHGDFQREAIRVAVEYGFVDSARTEIAERKRCAGYVETVS